MTRRWSRSTLRRFSRDTEEDREMYRRLTDEHRSRKNEDPLEVPVTDIVDPPVPGPDHTNPAPPSSNGHKTLPDPPAKTEVHRRDRDRRPIRPEWTEDPWGNIKWEAGFAAHKTGFHIVRIPWYGAQLVGWTPRGLWRLYGGLWRYGRDEEARPLRAAHVEAGDTPEFLVLRQKAQWRALLATGAGLLLPAAEYAALADPGTRWPTLLGSLAGLGFLGRPVDRPMVPSAVVADPQYKKITPDMILRALAAAGLCKQGEDPAEAFDFVAPGVGRDGPGWAAIIDLPFGVTADKAIDARTKIAAGLRVDEFRLFVDRVRGDGGHAGRVRLWISDRDPYAQRPIPTPLLKSQRWDIWQPVPFGINERGDLVKVQMMWTSFLIGAVPRMGKTYTARLLAAAAALDPFVRLIVFDGKGGKDWAAFEKVAHRFGAGPDDDVVEALLQTLKEQVIEMRRRYKQFRNLDDKVCPEAKLTPGLARNRDLDMPVTVIVIDEFQLYIEHPKYGGEILALLTTLAKVGPGAGFIFVLATQKPSSASMKGTDFRDVLGTRFAMRVTTREFSEMILGSGAAKAGLDASRFLASHKGIGILLGTDDGDLTDKGGQTVRNHLLDLEGTTQVLDRARDLREGEGTLTGVAAGEDPVLSMRVLEHVVQAFRGEDQAHSETLCARMIEDYPGEYRDGDWDPNDLAAALRRFGITGRNQIWAPRIEDGEATNRRGFKRQPIIDAIAERTAIPDSPEDEESA